MKKLLPSELRTGNTVGSVIAWALSIWLVLAVFIVGSCRLYLRGGADWYPAPYDGLSWLPVVRLALEEQQRRRTQVHTHSWVLPEAVIRCRSGDAAGALEGIDRDFRTLETSGSGFLLPMMRIVRAFAAAQAGVERPQLLAAIEPMPLRDLGWSRSWPELRRWLEANGKVVG